MTRALLLLATLVAPSAYAEPFTWKAPAKCPRADDVVARIERRLGAPVGDAVRGVEIRITREGAGFVAEIDARALTVANDVRTLRSARCDELADAIAVILARLATEQRERVTTAPEAVLAVELPSAPSERELPAAFVRRDVVASPPAVRAKKWGGGVRLLGLSGVGALPRINIGVELGAYARRETAFAELAAGIWVPQDARLDPGGPARVDVSLKVVTLRGGWATEKLPIRAWLMAEAGVLSGAGMDVIDPRTAASSWFALGGGFGVAWPMSQHARLVGTFELAIPLKRTTFMLENGGSLFTPAAAAARCALGLEFGWR